MSSIPGQANVENLTGASGTRIQVTCTLKDPNQASVYEGVQVPLLAQLRRQDSANAGELLKEDELKKYKFAWSARFGNLVAAVNPAKTRPWEAVLDTSGIEVGTYTVEVEVSATDVVPARGTTTVEVMPRPLSGDSSISVVLGRTASQETSDTILSPIIRGSTTLLGFEAYSTFVDTVMCKGPTALPADQRDTLIHTADRRGTPFPGVDAYQLLKVATEVYVMLNCGVLPKLTLTPKLAAEFNRRHNRSGRTETLNAIWAEYLKEVNGTHPGTDEPIKTLPYLAAIRRRLKDSTITTVNPINPDEGGVCDGIMEKKLTRPCFFELIWSYWHEEGMLVQTMNAIAMRFQNQRVSDRDPLAQLDIDPLRPLSNLLWGYIQDEQHRLTVARRAYEYDHHYGLTLEGKAVPVLRSADSRSKFLEAFHNLLHAALLFYDQDDDTTVKADGFSVLNGLKETHLLLTEGMHNQFGDLPSNARIEMLMQQWILARPEMREFIGGRTMVSYTEDWMDRVDTMKRLQGWTDVSVTYFNELARFGEQLLLSIRYGQWSAIVEPESAANWAREWRAEVKQYVHAYRAVTGVDLSPGQVDQRLAADRYAQPSVHLRKRLNDQRQRPAAAAVPLSRRTVTPGRNGNGTSGTRPVRNGQANPVLSRETE